MLGELFTSKLHRGTLSLHAASPVTQVGSRRKNTGISEKNVRKPRNIWRCLLPRTRTRAPPPAPARRTMRNTGMELFRRILSVMGFDCMRRTASAQRSASRHTLNQVDGRDSRSQSCSSSVGTDLPHCQNCISYDAYLKQLSCGHMYCDSCMDRIVNQAFMDIESLWEYPCPMCKSICQLGLQVPEGGLPQHQQWNSAAGSH